MDIYVQREEHAKAGTRPQGAKPDRGLSRKLLYPQLDNGFWPPRGENAFPSSQWQPLQLRQLAITGLPSHFYT